MTQDQKEKIYKAMQDAKERSRNNFLFELIGYDIAAMITPDEPIKGVQATVRELSKKIYIKEDEEDK